MTEQERAGDVAARARTYSAAWRKAAETWAFRGLDDPDPVLVLTAEATTGWACPNVHAAVVTLTSRGILSRDERDELIRRMATL